MFPLITFPYVTRILLPEGMGKVAFFTAISQYGIILAGLGISTYGIRATAMVRDDKEKLSATVKELFCINFSLSAIVVLGLFAVTPFYPKFQQEFILLALNCFFILANSMGLSWLFVGLEQFDYITIRSLICKTISLVLVFALVKKASDYWIYAAIIVFSSAGAYFFNYYYSKKFVSFSSSKKMNLRQHFKPMLLLFSSSLAINVYTNLDTVMLGLLCDNTQVGLYSMSVKIKNLLLIVVYTISTTLLPRMSYYVGNKLEDEYRNVLKKSTIFVLLIAIPMILFFVVNAKTTILVLGGNKFLGSVVCMQILMPIIIISGISNITGNQILIPFGKDSCFTKAVTTGACINLFLNLLLMPRLFCIGAAIATLAAEIIQMSIQLFYSKDKIKFMLDLKEICLIVSASVAATIVIVCIQRFILLPEILNLIVSFGIFGMVFVGMLIIFREREIINILTGFLRKLHNN